MTRNVMAAAAALLFLLMSFAGVMPAAVSAAEGDRTVELDNVIYTISGSQATATQRKTANPEEVVIHGTVEGVPVTAVGDEAFSDYYNLKKVTIGEGITHIGASAFTNCQYLQEVILPESLKSIGKEAFCDCNHLTELYIPDGVTELGEGMLRSCEALTAVHLPVGLKTIPKRLFEECRNLNYVELPAQLETIGESAFYRCRALTYAIFPDSLRTIGYMAFAECNGLQFVQIPYGMTALGKGAFQDCEALEWVELPYGFKRLEESVFKGCSSLTKILLPDSLEFIGRWTFSGCGALEELYIPRTITDIRYAVFENCMNFKRIYYAGTASDWNKVYTDDTHNKNNRLNAAAVYTDVRKIENAQGRYLAFPDKTAFLYDWWDYSSDSAHVSVDKVEGCAVTVIKPGAFSNCDNIQSITFADTVTDIQEYAFYDCDGLQQVTLPPSLEWVRSYTFEGCDKLETVILPQGLKHIEDGAFADCRMLRNIDLPETMQYIGSYAFLNCELLERVYIAEGVWNINRAFIGCSGMKAFDVNDNNTTYYDIDGVIYYREGHRVHVYPAGKAASTYAIADGTKQADEFSFYGCQNLKELHIPDSMERIGWAAFADCPKLTTVYMPSSIIDIQNEAFWNCPNLRKVYYDGSRSEWKAIKVGVENECLTNADVVFARTIVFEDAQAGVRVSAEKGVVADGTEISVALVPQEDDAVAYSLTMTKNGSSVTPRGELEVVLPVPNGMDGTMCKVYRLEEDGTVTDMQEGLQGNTLVFVTECGGTYRIEEAQEPRKGDLNSDDRITVQDAVMLYYHVNGKTPLFDESGADIDGDGRLTIADAVRVYYHVNGKEGML